MVDYSNYGSYGLGSTSVNTSSLANLASIGIWAVIALVIAIFGGICLYYTVFSKKNEKNYTGFMAKLCDFVKFKKMYISTFLKVVYLISAIYITLVSFGLIATSFLAFILTLIVGNIVVRFCFEFALVILSIYENTNDINKKMK